MADAGVSAVISKLSEVASAEATALLKVDGHIRTLRQRLGYLQAVVRGADQQRRGCASELLLLWVRETREVAFDVEDAVDEFHLKVEMFQVVARHVLSREITKINERIKEIEQIKDTYNIGSTPSEIWSVSFIDEDTTWDIEDGSVELRSAEFETLKKTILDKEERISHRAVISIIGPSGTGKTRLARNLYNDIEIQEHFDVLAWICLPPCIRFEQYVDMIYEKIRPQVLEENMRSRSVCGTSGKLRGLLEEKKYLVVVDGVVDIVHWNSLLDLLPAGNSKSRILATSKLSTKEIKHADRKVPPMELHPLDVEQTAKLFDKRVFGVVGMPVWSPMWTKDGENTTDLGNRVHNISRGLPLAVIVLAGILRAKDYTSEWEDLLSEKLEVSKGQPKAMRCLWWLAFEDLPHHLKSCFLYLATAPENMLLDPDRLVRLWMAEGFISTKKGRTLEEVGMAYLKELVCRGLVEVVEKDARGGIKVVALHSLLHSFAQSEAQECSFLEIHHHANVLNPHVARRLAIHNFLDRYIDIPDQFPKLRSLFCDFLEDNAAGLVSGHDGDGLAQQQSHWSNIAELFLRACGWSGTAFRQTKLHQLSIIRSSRFLRVIDLHGLLLVGLPDEIGSIIHLRYLGVRNCWLQELPESISKLDNLQTLDVRKTKVATVTDGLWEISVLRHVLAETLHLHFVRPSPPCQRVLQLELAPSRGPDTRRETQSLNSSPTSPFILPNLGKLTMSGSGNLMQDFVDKVAVMPNLAEMELLGGSYIGAELVIREEAYPSLNKLTLADLENLDKLELQPGSAPNLAILTKCGCTKMELIDGRKTQSAANGTPLAIFNRRINKSAGNGDMPILQETENHETTSTLITTHRPPGSTLVNMYKSG
ncbi:hypothetical protein CFC21_106281 [Triticum aestivum]|uniref:NB-ARC domain-containing protein n=2 Tax=Triticum aestivum TaxID=4565 RepID=A0A9R1MDV1_WHEAT|nr:hypothetical protein CFC21_106281 [Triticum aestivum]